MEFSLYGKLTASAAMNPLRLERREPARNLQRFYAISVTRTLFDGWALVREWGRIGQPGTVRETWFETEGEAIEAGAKVRQRKEKRGYRAVGRFSKAGGKGENEAGASPVSAAHGPIATCCNGSPLRWRLI